ncbi:MAG: acetoacetyl-CoA reductase [Gammaproteobacteria bacterium]|jgi:acetoacetyl-CoA reductase
MKSLIYINHIFYTFCTIYIEQILDSIVLNVEDTLKGTDMNRVALVTGGTRGIGEAICNKLFEKGYNVVANYGGNDGKASEFTLRTGIPVAKFDVSNFEQTATGIAKIENEYGPVDILINNAGITRDARMNRMTFEQWDIVIQTNLASCFNVCRAVIDGMRIRQFGRIINVGSVNGQAGQYGQVNYAAAKSGIHGFTKALALESAGKGITVNAIAPGYVDTDLVRAVPPEILAKIIKTIPVGRLGQPDDIANSVAFLADDQSSFITGSTLTVNGGQHMY